jgi:hypothetical protein
MWRKGSPLILSLFLAAAVPVGASQLRVTASAGVGTASSSNEISKSEGPFAQIYGFEYILNTKNVLGVEHYRSFALSGMATSIAFTGVSYRWYLNNVPGPYNNLQKMELNTFQVRDLAFYTGGTVGIAQSSLPPDIDGKVANAAGFYLDPKFGMELALTSRWSFRSEFNYLMMVFGTGSMSAMSLSAGLSYLF